MISLTKIKVGFTIVKVWYHVFFFLQVTISVMTDFLQIPWNLFSKTMVNFQKGYRCLDYISVHLYS